MEIGKNHKIESDELNVTLYQRPPKGKKTWRMLGYFSSVENALKHLVNHEVNVTGLGGLQTVVDKQRELRELIESLRLPRRV